MRNKKTDENQDIIDLGKERLVRDKIEKIREIYKNDPDGLKRLVDKLKRTDEDELPLPHKKHALSAPALKVTASGPHVSVDRTAPPTEDSRGMMKNYDYD